MSPLPHGSRSARAPVAALLALLLAGPAAARAPADLVMPPLGAPERLAPEDLGVSALAPARASVAASPKPAAQPANVVSPAGWSFESNIAGRTLGTSAQPAGDLNGDGIGDFAALGNVNSFNTALYIFFGSAAGPVLAAGYPVTNLPPDAGLAPAGDVNNDGRDDLALFWYGNGNLRLYFGSASGVDLVGYNALNGYFGVNAFGLHGGPAGDVNGDGYGDVIFGLPNFGGTWPCAAAPNSGRADVLFGSATGLSAANNWFVAGCYANNAGAFLGSSVAGAGDVNGDGYGDIVVGIPGADIPLEGVLGQVCVFYGSATGLPLLPGFSNMGSVTQGTRINGHHLFASFGGAVSAAGDLNGDGYADVAVGAPTDDNYGNDAGMAFVFRGSAAGVDTATANLLWWESAGVPGARFGERLAPAGDVNGDGRPDLLVGETSRVNLAQGAGGTLVIVQSLLHASSGSVVRTAGDVNGDGLSDLLVGDFNHSNGEALEGRVLVYSGVADPPSLFANWTLNQSAIDNPNLGWSVAAGDVNGDGYEDVLVGSPTWYNFTVGGSTNNGLLMLYYGHATGLSPSYDWFYYGANNDQVGLSVATADVNGDGFADVLASAHTAAGNTGQVRVWYGSASGPSVSGPNLNITGPDPGGYFGACIAAAGDVNGDGYPDVIVGANYAEDPVSPLADEGRAYVFRGSAGGLVTTPIWARSGGQANAHLGTSVSGAGDVNGDGFADVVVGVPDFDTVDLLSNPVPDGGKIIVAFGSPGGPSTESGRLSLAPWRYGAAVAGAGDVNGDGYSDVIVGAPSATNTISGEGGAQVIAGASFGLGGVVWTQYGGEAFGGYGSAVSGAGDANADGLSDVLVGAVFQDMGGPQDQGRAYLYKGPLPAGAAPIWTGSGGSAFANLGHSLANAGDVNGDGWTDYVFGLPGYNGSGWRQGQARVHHGAQGGGVFQIELAYHFTAPAHVMQPDILSDPGSVGLLSTARSSAGRTRVRLQHRVTPVVGLPAPALAGFTPWVLTNAPGSNGSLAGIIAGVSGLTPGVPYAWELRTLAKNVYYPSGPWRSPPRSGRRETDFRVPGSYLDVAEGPARSELQLADVRPNPMHARTAVVFSLTRAGDVSLAVHDVQGRRVRTLARGAMAAGEHRVTWDGLGDDGAAASAGVYLVRLEAEGRVLSRKVVRMR